MSKAYRSSISASARERVVKRYEDGFPEQVEYLVGRKVVGVRIFDDAGDLEYEYGLKAGKKHGMQYCWFAPGKLLSAAPFVNGMPHGIARQWDIRGRIVGKYKMVRGTGLDLWWQWRSSDDSPYLAETIFYRNGKCEGFEWWIEEDQCSVYIERHWHDGKLHGIYREWGPNKSLDRGFPQFFVHGEKVTKREYIKASKSDTLLPQFRLQDNEPQRVFPAQIARHLTAP